MAKEDFWNDADKATEMLKERTAIAGVIDACNDIFSDIEDVEVMLELAKEESDKSAEQEAGQMLDRLEKKVKRFSLEITLDGEDDARDAIVSINAGAGGT
ncbi:MAG: PCRF domain-containing protein, partial [Desulfobacterales bacterium]|nr:PCRF domain-containing protein [Desulfobacterales bacterium]